MPDRIINFDLFHRCTKLVVRAEMLVEVKHELAAAFFVPRGVADISILVRLLGG